MNREEAIKATKNGAIAALISGGMTLVIVFYAIFINDNSSLSIWNDTSNFFDIILIFGCAFGIYKKSRFATTLIFLYFIFAKILIGIELGKLSGVGSGLVFLYFYGKAVQGAFTYHKIEKAENPYYKPTPKWIYYASIPTGIVFLLMLGLTLMIATGVVPSAEVKSGSNIKLKNKDILVYNNIVDVDDNILYFYSWGFTNILEGGSLITEDRFILYVNDENKETQVYELYFNDITSVELIQMGNFFNDSIYKINTQKSDVWLQFALSTENRGDVIFIEELRGRINKSN